MGSGKQKQNKKTGNREQGIGYREQGTGYRKL
jgi:hypothetical protein